MVESSAIYNLLIIASSEELIELFQKIKNKSTEMDLQIKKNKTKVIIVDRQNNKKTNSKTINNIKTVDSFIHFEALRNQKKKCSSLGSHDQTHNKLEKFKR